MKGPRMGTCPGMGVCDIRGKYLSQGLDVCGATRELQPAGCGRLFKLQFLVSE